MLFGLRASGGLQFALIEIQTSLIPDGDPRDKLALVDQWEAVLAAGSIPGGMVSGNYHVAWALSLIYIKEQAVLGMLLTAGVCFLVLLLSTCNYVIALFAMLLVGGILGSVLSVINTLIQW